MHCDHTSCMASCVLLWRAAQAGAAAGAVGVENTQGPRSGSIASQPALASDVSGEACSVQAMGNRFALLRIWFNICTATAMACCSGLKPCTSPHTICVFGCKVVGTLSSA